MWRYGTRSTLAQVIACCLTALTHYLNQCWLIIREVPWHSSGCIIMRRSEETNQQNKIENCSFKMASRAPRGQWGMSPCLSLLGILSLSSTISLVITVAVDSYCQISWSLEPRAWMLWWPCRSEMWQASRRRCCWGACQISGRLDISRDLAVRRASA